MEHRPLAARLGLDARVAGLSFRNWTLLFLGYPEAALADADHALEDAREIGQAATLMNALSFANYPDLCGNYGTANAFADELIPLADEKGACSGRPSEYLCRVVFLP